VIALTVWVAAHAVRLSSSWPFLACLNVYRKQFYPHKGENRFGEKKH